MITNFRWDDLLSNGRPFIKMQGLRNHFIIIDGREEPYQPSKAQVIRICDVKQSVGAEQLLIIQPPTREGLATGAYAFMRIINIDGNDAQACGNAMRCFAWLMLEETGQDRIVLETVVGSLACERMGDYIVSAEMGKISTHWKTIPLSRKEDTLHVPISSGLLNDAVVLNIGNPHAVFFVEDLRAVDMEVYAPAIQNDPLFPEFVNVGAVEIVRDDYIKSTVYERPGVLTMACGSGACVAARAMQLRGYSKKNTFTVEMEAGAVEILLCEDGMAVMKGPVEFCYSGRLPL